MKLAFVFFCGVCAIASVYGQGVPHTDFVNEVRRGSIMIYNVDVTKCDVNLPASLPAYSFGEVMEEVYVEYIDIDHWKMYTATERPVNGSRFDTETFVSDSVWRMTEVEFTPVTDQVGTAVIRLTDMQQGQERKIFAEGEITCKNTPGQTAGFTVYLRRADGPEVNRVSDVIWALQNGASLTFSVDLAQCTSNGERDSRAHNGNSSPLNDGASNQLLLTAPITGYRIPGQGQKGGFVFTAAVFSGREREIFNIHLHGENQVMIQAYVLNLPNPVVTYRCTLGDNGSFKIFHQ